MMFPHQNIHKYAWISPDGKTYKQIHHILLDKTG